MRNPGGYGYMSFEEALNTVDMDNPCIGETFKIMGAVYVLTQAKDTNRLRFWLSHIRHLSLQEV